MLTEDDVVSAVARYLGGEGWQVVSTATTSQTGDDIRAERSGQVLLVEAKGATSAKSHTQRYGRPFSKNQVHDHVAKAIVRAMRDRSSGKLAAIALPDNAHHRAEVAKVQPALAHLHIAVLWVADHDEVTVEGVLGTPGQLPTSAKATTSSADGSSYGRRSAATPRTWDVL